MEDVEDEDDDEPNVAVTKVKPQAEWPQAPKFIEAAQPEITKSVEKLSEQMNQMIRKLFIKN